MSVDKGQVCSHEADVSTRELARALGAGRTLVNGEIMNWRFRCRKCGAELLYTNPFAGDPKYWVRMSWLVSGPVLLPVILICGAASVLLFKSGIIPGDSVWAAFGLLILFIIILLAAGKLSMLLLARLIKRGKIGKFVAIPHDPWMKLSPIDEAMNAPEKQAEIKAQRKAMIVVEAILFAVLAGIFVMMLTLKG